MAPGLAIPYGQEVAGLRHPADRHGSGRADQRRWRRLAPCLAPVPGDALVLAAHAGPDQHQDAAVLELDAGRLPAAVARLDPLALTPGLPVVVREQAVAEPIHPGFQDDPAAGQPDAAAVGQ